MKATKKLTIGIVVCYSIMIAFASVERDETEILGWICAALWAIWGANQ